MPAEIRPMLAFSRGQIEALRLMDRRLVEGLRAHPLLTERVAELEKIDGVGMILALTWVLEMGDPSCFPSIGDAVSYCGLTSAQSSSAGKDRRGPISKQRNKHIQRVLVEAAKTAPQWNAKLKQVHDHQRQRGHPNRATLAVARKLVAWLLAADRSTVERVKAPLLHSRLRLPPRRRFPLPENQDCRLDEPPARPRVRGFGELLPSLGRYSTGSVSRLAG